jgi:outer membrane receptor protein involved in Fe transport
VTQRIAGVPAGITAGILALALISVDVSRADSAADPLEYIVVTGTRIVRVDFESSSPIMTVPQEAFASTGAISLERTLAEFPQFVPSADGTSNNPGNDGQANVSLRGLGANRTLVLLDGRRLIPADGGGSVDLNIIPPALVESVQVMTGGASAVYGSDAIAGVVNLKLRQQFEGLVLDGSAAQTEHGDGETTSAGVTAGTRWADGRGSVMAHLGYARREQIGQDERSFSRYPLDYIRGYDQGRGPGGAFIGSGSAITDDGINIVFSSTPVFSDVFARYGFPPGSVPYQAGIGVNADGTVFTTGNGAPGSVVNFRGERDPVMFSDRAYNVYNFAPDTALQMPLERTNAFLGGSFDLPADLELYAQALYADYSVTRQLAPAAAGIVLIPVGNPFNPPDLRRLLQSRAAPNAPFRYFRRMSEVGPQQADNDRSVLQATAGFRGQVGADWTFDAYAQYGRNERTERQTRNISLSRLQDLSFAADGGKSICDGGFNPHRAGSLSKECADYVAIDAANDILVQQSIVEASVTGPLATLPAGDLQAAFGALYKRDEYDYDASDALSGVLPGVPGVIGPRPAISGFAPSPDRSGDDSNTDVYAELRVPLLDSRRGAELLELGLGYRYSQYRSAGNADSYKAEALYSPVVPLRVRASFQHAVRAPSLEELYYPPVASQFIIPIPDPCDAGSPARTGPDRAQVEALCLAQGLPPALLPQFDYELRRVDGVSGGNQELRSEEADTLTLGFTYAWSPGRAGLEDLRLAVDAYRIEIDQGIGRWDAESAVARCFDPRYNPGYDVANVYCTFFRRDATTGFIFAELIDRNIGGLETSGVDVQLDWGFAAGPGSLAVNALVTYVDSWRYLDPGGGEIEYAGTVGGGGLGRSLPQWKTLLNLNYRLAEWSAFLRWQHLDGTRDVVERDFAVPGRDYLSLGAGYAVSAGMLQGLSLRAGVENLLDEQPPIFPTWQQANTDPSQYDVLGRRYFVRAEYRLR